MERERHVSRISACQARDRDRLARLRLPAFDRKRLKPSADDHLDENLVACLSGVDGAANLPVSQHRDAVGDLEDLVEVVGDEQNAGARRGDFPDDREELVAVACRQEDRRLVEDE